MLFTGYFCALPSNAFSLSLWNGTNTHLSATSLRGNGNSNTTVMQQLLDYANFRDDIMLENRQVKMIGGRLEDFNK